MIKEQAMVEEFHRKFGAKVNERPAVLTEKDYELRYRLIREELEETLVAMKNGNLVKISDGLADMLYVVLGTAVAYGIDMDEIFQKVHAANMRKEGGGTRPDGKILKPPGWVGPEAQIAAEIAAQQTYGHGRHYCSVNKTWYAASESCCAVC